MIRGYYQQIQKLLEAILFTILQQMPNQKLFNLVPILKTLKLEKEGPLNQVVTLSHGVKIQIQK